MPEYQATETDQNIAKPFAPVSDQFNIDATMKSGSATLPQFGIVEVDSYDATTDPDTFVVTRPASDSLSTAAVAFTRGHTADAGEPLDIVMNPTKPVWVAYDTADGTPTVDGEVGTKAGSYLASASNTGLYVLAVDTTEERVLVRPFSSGVVTFSILGEIPEQSKATEDGDEIVLAEDYEISDGNYTILLDNDDGDVLNDSGFLLVECFPGSSAAFRGVLYVDLLDSSSNIVDSVKVAEPYDSSASSGSAFWCQIYSLPQLFSFTHSGGDKTINKIRYRFDLTSGVLTRWIVQNTYGLTYDTRISIRVGTAYEFITVS